MKRMDRLMAILMALQHRPETAQSLADKFEVSKRTILRDMEALCEMGVPLYSSTGPSGGFRLMDGYMLPPLQFNSMEALTVLFALRGMTQLPDSPFNEERWTVMDKIKHVLPQETRSQIAPLLEKMELTVPKRKYRAPFLAALLDYASASAWVRAFYRSQNHQRWLTLFPQRIYAAHGFWYCEAYSTVHQESRSFRIDRFEKLLPLEDEAELAAAMAEYRQSERHAPEGEEAGSGQMAPATIHIRARLTYRGLLQVEQDEHIGECVRALDEDVWEVSFDCPQAEWEWAIRFFYQLGLEAEVLEPAALRVEICRIAERMCIRYHAQGEKGGSSQ